MHTDTPNTHARGSVRTNTHARTHTRTRTHTHTHAHTHTHTHTGALAALGVVEVVISAMRIHDGDPLVQATARVPWQPLAGRHP